MSIVFRTYHSFPCFHNINILYKKPIDLYYLGPRMLEEYEIQMEALQIKSFNNISQAIVKFVFRRRIEYHVTKTFLQVNILVLIMILTCLDEMIYYFLQTFILVFIGYLSFYFDVENFTDRAMVVLTTMLVIATITSSIEAVLNLHFLELSISVNCYLHNLGIL